jgi:hypothetical protein
MTKVIILGKDEPKQKELKRIEFVDFLDEGLSPDDNVKYHPYEWCNIELISKNYIRSGMDIMYAYNDDRNIGILYLGHFNDGVV